MPKRANSFCSLVREVLTRAALIVMLVAAMPTALAESEVIRVHEVPAERIQQLRHLGDFWGTNWREDYVNVHVTPRGRAAIEALGYRVDTDVRRTQALRDFLAVDREAWRLSGAGGIPGFPCYRTVDETHADLAALAGTYPNLASWEAIGETWLATQGNPGGDNIYVLAIGNQDSPHPQAPLLIMGAQHARELVTAEVATRFAEWLLENYDDDPAARWLVDHRQVHIVAQQNPDGRRAVEAGQSLWRKNSNLNACPGGTPGVDLNRNSTYFWGDYSSGNTCNQTYRGISPASEPETQAVQDYMHQIFENHWPDGTGNDPVPSDASGLFLSLHSYSELILFPWEGSGGGASNDAPNHDQLAYLGRKLGFFTDYAVGRDILYSAGGTMTDYAHGEFGVSAYTYEIGTSFQQSCASFEQSIWPDILDSLVYSAKATERPYQAPAGPDITALQAAYDSSKGVIEISGMADDTRYSRGGSAEHPADDPIFDVTTVTASFDVPPHLAVQTLDLALDGTGTVVGFSDQFMPDSWTGGPRLLFVQATNSAGHAGVPEAVWVQERMASITPDAFSFEVAVGQVASDTLAITNIGSEPLDWLIESELPATTTGGHNPLLDETLEIDSFTIPGGGNHSDMVGAGVTSRGQVVGFTFQGTVSGISGNQTWASDLAMTVTAPEGESFSVGGYQTGNPPWNFDGSGSGNDGTYTSTHSGAAIFGEAGALDAGQWQFAFEHTFNNTMNWTDVTVTLLKQEPPECVAPEAVAWLDIAATGGSTPPGQTSNVEITVDAAELNIGFHQAQLCVSTNDPILPLKVIPVSAEVTESQPDSPVIEVHPPSLNATVDQDDAGSGLLEITNSGQDLLEWSVDDASAGCDLPGWAGTSPLSGQLGQAESEMVSVTFDATSLTAGGYQATLCLASNDPANPLVEVDLDLTVVATNATVKGTIISLGYCQLDPSALNGADLLVTGQQGNHITTTDGSGFYQLDLPASESPVSIEVSAADHRSASADKIGLIAGETVEMDFEMILQSACATVDPASLTFNQLTDTQAERSLVVSNADGGDDLSWSLETGAGCHDPGSIGWLSISHTGATIAWGSHLEIVVSTDSSGLAPGTYTTSLCLSTSDSEQNALVIPVELDVELSEIFHDRFESDR